jgi:hypothetical protein
MLATSACDVPPTQRSIVAGNTILRKQKILFIFPPVTAPIFRSTRDVAEVGPEIGSVQGASMTDRVDLIYSSLLLVSPRARY